MTSAVGSKPAPLNVLFLTHSFPRHSGDAAGSFILRLARALAEHDITVSVLAPHAPTLPVRDCVEGIDVIRFRYAPRSLETLAYTGTMAEQVQSSWTARAALLSLLGAGLLSTLRTQRRDRPALLHAHWWFPAGVIGAMIDASTSLPLITTMHGSDVRLARNSAAAEKGFRWVMRRSRTASTVSRWLADQAHAMSPATTRPQVAPMPAATDLFFPGGNREPNRLLFVGRLNAQKGIELLLRAIAETRHATMLDVVGEGDDAASLRALAEALGIATRVTWHGALPQHRLPDYYRRAAALVVPSRDEGLGLVAVEAQLCETPVIGFDSGGLPDIIANGGTGVLVRDFTPLALSRAIDELLDEPGRAAVLGQAARRAALEVFSPSAVARNYARIYRDALLNSSRSGR
jgi:glycosyltransferase involved in cell wall biosynthesis